MINRILKTHSFFLMLLISILVKAQDTKIIDRIVFGGNFGLSIGTYTNIEVSPIIGFKITPKFIAGVGYIFNYFKVPTDYGVIRTAIHGGKVFSSYTVVNDMGEYVPFAQGLGLFLHGEFDVLSLENRYFNALSNDQTGRFLINGFYVGGGITQQISRRAALNLYLLYNVNQSIYSPYSNPLIRIGLYF